MFCRNSVLKIANYFEELLKLAVHSTIENILIPAAALKSIFLKHQLFTFGSSPIKIRIVLFTLASVILSGFHECWYLFINNMFIFFSTKRVTAPETIVYLNRMYQKTTNTIICMYEIMH